jgi:hypothetical protein
MSTQDTGSGPTGKSTGKSSGTGIGTGIGKPGLIQQLGWKLFGQPAGDVKPRPGWVYSIPVLGFLGVLITLIYVSQVGGGKRWIVFGTALAIAFAAALVGGVVGFLFGIPLTSKQRAAAANGSQYETNTNLEQVSEWLTKIIVGVGLVQLGRALPALTRLAKSLNGPLGGTPYGGAFGLGLTIFYALLGFLFLYLWSRIDFTNELQQLAEVVKTQIGEVESAVSNALSLVNRQLNSLKGGQPPTPDELSQAVIAVPDSTRVQIFNQAEHVRNVNMNDDKALMALTIPVFRALVAADTDDKYHRNHGSLGWALKDKLPPDWRQAAAELTKAIAIRDGLNITGWRLYEANRALCNINILKDPLQQGDPTGEELTQSIEQDLAAAQLDPYARPMVDPDFRDPASHEATVNHDIQNWIAGQHAALYGVWCLRGWAGKMVRVDEELAAELLARADRDQAARTSLRRGHQMAEWHAVVAPVDRDNTARLREILGAHGWPGHRLAGEAGAHAAWLLVQHAPPDLQEECLPLLKDAVAQGDARPVDLAYLTDRVLAHRGEPQIYGTQYQVRDGVPELWTVRDPDGLDERRAALGMEPEAENRARLLAAYERKPR